MSDRVERLLQPLSAEQPCGPDLSYDSRLDQLETMLKGKPEVDIGNTRSPAEPPDWATLQKRALEFLAVSKHLRVATMLCCSALKVEGFAGLRDGVQFVRGLIEKYWATVNPRLDPDDNNDPQQRLSILSALTVARNTSPGWLQIIDYIHTTPLCRPAGVPPITLDDVLAVGGTGAVPAAATPRRPAPVLSAQIKSVPVEELAATRAIVAETLESVRAIDAALVSTLGAHGTIGFEELESVLQKVQNMLAEYSGAGAPAEMTTTTEIAGAAAPGVSVTGAIRSRADVLRVLDSVCDYYRQAEPGSPVPYLLRRAQKLVSTNFVDAMQELNLATVDQLRALMGSAVEPDASPPEASSS